MADREIVRAYLTFGAIGDAYAADVSAVNGQPEPMSARSRSSLRLGVERDDADTTQVGQFGWDLPVGHGLPRGAAVRKSNKGFLHRLSRGFKTAARRSSPPLWLVESPRSARLAEVGVALAVMRQHPLSN